MTWWSAIGIVISATMRNDGIVIVHFSIQKH